MLLEGEDGTSVVVAVVGLTFVYDTAAFLAGSVWGGQFFERPLARDGEPQEVGRGRHHRHLGYRWVLAGRLVTSFVNLFEQLRIEALLLGLVVAAAATFEDLAESLVKRDYGIKDMGSVLPGHGGCWTGSTRCCSWLRRRSSCTASSSPDPRPVGWNVRARRSGR